MSRIVRLLRIVAVGLRFGLHEFVPPLARNALLNLFFSGRTARGERLRQALETLGLIFVKFGQVLSTRRDILPLDIADELAKLQDRVPPFDSALAAEEIERSLGKRISEIFQTFQKDPVASALNFAPDPCRHCASPCWRTGRWRRGAKRRRSGLSSSPGHWRRWRVARST